jgi:hypothetical protein
MKLQKKMVFFTAPKKTGDMLLAHAKSICLDTGFSRLWPFGYVMLEYQQKCAIFSK